MHERAEETGSWFWLTKNCAKRRAFDEVDGQHAVRLLRLDWAHKEVVQSALFGPPNPRPTMTPPHHGGFMLLPKD
eukprot:1147955-Pelagomonas_calceolata.AAC.1